MATALPTTITLILPFIVTALSGLIAHDQAPQWANALIVAFVLVVLSVGAALLNRGLTPNLVADFVIIAGYSAALMASPVLKPLYQWLSINTPSPLAALAKLESPVIIAQGASQPPQGGSCIARPPQPLNLPDRTPPQSNG